MAFRKFKYIVEELWVELAGALFLAAMALWLVPRLYHDAIGEAGLDSNARPTIATVVRSGKNVIIVRSGGPYSVPHATYGVVYRYIVNGKSYTGRIKGREYEKNHPEGGKIQIYYNMKSPEHSSISKSNPSRKPVSIISSAVFISLFIILPTFLWLGLYKRTKSIAVRYDELYEW